MIKLLPSHPVPPLALRTLPWAPKRSFYTLETPPLGFCSPHKIFQYLLPPKPSRKLLESLSPPNIFMGRQSAFLCFYTPPQAFQSNPLTRTSISPYPQDIFPVFGPPYMLKNLLLAHIRHTWWSEWFDTYLNTLTGFSSSKNDNLHALKMSIFLWN